MLRWRPMRPAMRQHHELEPEGVSRGVVRPVRRNAQLEPQDVEYIRGLT